MHATVYRAAEAESRSHRPEVLRILLHPDDCGIVKLAPGFEALSGKAQQVLPGVLAVVYVHRARVRALKGAPLPPMEQDR